MGPLGQHRLASKPELLNGLPLDVWTIPWWDFSMALEKISLSLDAQILEKARQIAGRRGLSALVNDALRIRLQQERLRRLLAEMDDEFGPVPPEEIEDARKTWPGPHAG